MGKASSSKKVQRAAKAAASSRGSGETRERGFPILVSLVILLGIGLVIAARESRDALVAPLLEDHWHLGYEVYDCGEVQPQLLNERDPDGIHTHGDSLIHIHPFNSSATGDDARLGVFLDASGLSVTEDSINSEEGRFPAIEASTGCGDADAEIVVARYAAGENDSPVTVFRSDFSDIRFLENLETLIIAKVPVGEDPPVPGANVLAQLVTHGADTNETSDTPFTLGDEEGDGTATTTTVAEDPEADPEADPDAEPEETTTTAAEATDTTTTGG